MSLLLLKVVLRFNNWELHFISSDKDHYCLAAILTSFLGNMELSPSCCCPCHSCISVNDTLLRIRILINTQ